MEVGKVTFGNIGIGEVIYLLKKDPFAKAKRKNWNGKNTFIRLQVVDKYSKMKEDYIYVTGEDGNCVPWTPSQTDMLKEDWLVEVCL